MFSSRNSASGFRPLAPSAAMSTKVDAVTDHVAPLAIEGNRRRLDAEELPDEARQGGHRAAGRAARDRRHRVALLGGGARVRDEADRPVSLAHLLRRQAEDDEAEAVERNGAVGPAFDLKRHRELAVALGRPHRQLAGDAGADEVAVAGFVVLAAHVPGRRRHVPPP